MKHFHFSKIEAEDAEVDCACKGVKVRWLITEEMGAKNFAMRLFEVDPGGFSPFHSHRWEHEVFILEGEGIVVGGGKERKFGVGDVIFISPNEKHQFKNTSKKTVKFLCLVPSHK
jgi:quercetin dioxygenase-like cupin family protein